MNNTINAYITDLDGTLCDTRLANTVAYEQAFNDASIEFSRELYDECFGLRFDEMMDKLAANINMSQRKLVQERKRHHYANSLDLIKLNSGLLELLKSVKATGKLVGLATTAQSANAKIVLSHFFIEDLFDEIVYGDEVTKGKPNPECYITIMKKLNAIPSECLIFEDTDFGIEAAKSSGANYIKVVL
jgi:HAD superfamily hydrolase (TIGR01509 family)